MQVSEIKMPTRPDLLAVELEARRERARLLGVGFRTVMRVLRDLPARFLRPAAEGRTA